MEFSSVPARVAWSMLVALILAACESSSRNELERPRAMHPDLETIAIGDQSGIHEPKQTVVRDEASWHDLWRAHVSNQEPPDAAPKVDFTRNMVIAVLLGARPSGGHGVRIDRLTIEGDHLQVHAQTTSPPPGAITTSVITYPFHIIRSARFEGPVDFEIE